MKYVLFFMVVAMLMIAGCSEAAPQDVPQIEDIETESQLEDGIIYEDEDAIIEVVDGVVEVTVNESSITETLGGAPFSEWCIAGEYWEISEEGTEYAAQLNGVVSFKGSEWCQGETSQTTDIEYGSFTVDTTFYISEDQKSYWIVIDAMGQVTETFVNIDAI